MVQCKKLGSGIRLAKTQLVKVVPKDFDNLLKDLIVNLTGHGSNTGGKVLRVQRT